MNTAFGQLNELLSQQAEHAGNFQAVNNDEQAGKEENRCPVYDGENFFNLMIAFFVVFTEGIKQEQDGTAENGDCSVSYVKMLCADKTGNDEEQNA